MNGKSCPGFRFTQSGLQKETGKRSAERRIVKPMSAPSAAARCSSCGAPPFGAHTCGTRHRFHPMAQLQNRVSRGGGWQVFCPLRAKMPRLSTLRADRSSCRSTGDPKPPGCGRQIRARGPRLAFAVTACRPERRPAQSEVAYGVTEKRTSCQGKSDCNQPTLQTDNARRRRPLCQSYSLRSLARRITSTSGATDR